MSFWSSRPLAAAAAVALVVALGACGDDDDSSGGEAEAGGASAADVPALDLPADNVAVDAPGVTDTEIRVAGIASATNPIQLPTADSENGVRAYFEMVNDAGGIYGRQLVLDEVIDDGALRNETAVQSLVQKDVFAALPVDVVLFSGAKKLVDANIPTYGWNIGVQWSEGENLFGDKGSYLCFNCADTFQVLEWVTRDIGAERAAVLSYSFAQAAECADGMKGALDKYQGGAEPVLVDKSLPFGATDVSATVAKIADEDIDIVINCMDANGVVTVAQEMIRQGLDIPVFLPTAYDPPFLEENADVLEGAYVLLLFTPFETPEDEQPPGLKRFLAAMDAIDAEPTEHAMVGWVSADLFVRGLVEAGPEFTRQKVIDGLNSVTDYDAEGLVPTIDWTVRHDSMGDEVCYMVSQVKGDGTVEVRYGEPKRPFLCFPIGAEELPDQPVRRGFGEPGS